MVYAKELAVLATIVALAQCQPSFQEERGLYARGAPNYKAEFLADQAKLAKANKALASDGTTIKKVEAQDRMRGKELWADNWKLRADDKALKKDGKKLAAADKALGVDSKRIKGLSGQLGADNKALKADAARLSKFGKDASRDRRLKEERLKKDQEERLRMERKKNKLAARDPYAYSTGLYEREAYPDPYAMPLPSFDDNHYAGLQARDIYERDLYEQALYERDLDALYERNLHAREAYPEPEPEPEFDEYNHLAARDLQLRSILERDPDTLTERDIEILASSLSERDLHELLAREAEPEHELYARDAEAEADAYGSELYAREATAYQNEMHAREAEAEAEHEIYAREAEAEAEAEAEENLKFERDMPVVDMVKRMLGYQKE